MIKVFGLAAAALMLAAAGTAATASEPEQAAEEAKTEKKVCKNEKVTGSLTRVRRVCMTQREWDGLAESTSRGVNDMNRQQNTGGGTTS